MMRILGFVLLAALSTGCGAAQKKSLVHIAMSSPATRKEAVEDVLEDLDQHPDWVDEMYRAARKHPKTLDRLEADAARDLADPSFAMSTAIIADREPAGVAQAMTAIAAAMADEPVTTAAVAHALTEHPETAIAIVQDDPEAMHALLGASIKAARKSDKARLALIAAIQKNAVDLMKLLARDPNILKDLVEPIFAALEASPDSHQALVNAVRAATPRLVKVAAQDPKLLTELTETVLKAALVDKAALKQLLKKLLID